MGSWRSGLVRYGVAALVILLAAGVRWVLQSIMGPTPPYVTFYLAIVAAAAFGGLGPGVLATGVGAVLGIVLADTDAPLELTNLAEQVRLAIYVLSGLGISLIAAAMHGARDAANREAQRLRGVSEELRQANERLLEADQSRNNFLAVLSHELRNTLMPIKHSLYILERADSGIGMSADLLARVFEPFTQAEQKLDRNAGGLGLGLTLVKRLVELHGGTVQAQSAGEGKGSEFTVMLPTNAQPAPAPTHSPSPGGGARRRVLVVDDNVDSADSLSELLQTCGHEVDVCYRGEHALARARQFGPDTVLCDIGLPGMDGYDVARAMRDDPALRAMRLIALTGYASPEDREKAFAAGFDKHLVKPPSLEQLERVLV